jgi:hypothetical protein
MHDKMDCLTEQSQLPLKTKGLSRNKPKQSQITRPVVSIKLLIQDNLSVFLSGNTRNVQKTQALTGIDDEIAG